MTRQEFRVLGNFREGRQKFGAIAEQPALGLPHRAAIQISRATRCRGSGSAWEISAAGNGLGRREIPGGGSKVRGRFSHQPALARSLHKA